MADSAKIIIIDGSVVLRRTVSIKMMNDKSLMLVSAVNTLYDAADKIKFFKPDVIVLGFDQLDRANLFMHEKFIRETGLPMVIVTNDSPKLLHLTKDVRIEFVPRPSFGDAKLSDDAAEEICRRIKKIRNIPASTVEFTRPAASNLVRPAAAPQPAVAENTGLKPGLRSVYSIQSGNIVKPQLTTSKYGGLVLAIGSSTGGTEAIFEFLTKLPQDMPPILIVQHMPPVFTRLYAERLNLNSKVEVREAQNGDTIYPGLALVAPGDKQMCLKRRGGKLAVECVRTDKVSGHCPSVDLLFESVAETMGKNAIGIIMTGMGRDGAEGMLKMHNRGAYNIGQDQASSIVYGMPKAAFDLGAVDIQSTPAKIPELLQRVLRERVK